MTWSRSIERLSTTRDVLRIASLILALMTMVVATKADASRLAFRSFGNSEGLTSLSGACLAQDQVGYVLVCSEHGLFVYDGRRFINLGPAQGLREGGIVYDLAVTDTGMVAVRYADQLLVDDRHVSVARSPSAMSFHSVSVSKETSFYRERGFQLAPWRGGFAVISEHRTMHIVRSPAGSKRVLAPIPFSPAEQAVLDEPYSIFSVRDRLWETFADGRICSAEPGAVRCFGASEGLHGGPWKYVTAGPDGTVIARSVGSFATIDIRRGTVAEEVLPDQGGQYESYTAVLMLFQTPDGKIATQSSDGLIVRDSSHWRRLTIGDGIPSGVITGALPDRGGELWLQVHGNGLARGIGYGHWEAIQKANGLSNPVAWETARSGSGPMWVSTDTGLDEVRRTDGSLRVDKVIPGPSYALTVGPDGRIWSSAGDSNARVIDSASGSWRMVAMPAVNTIGTASDRRVWFGTVDGLYAADTPPDSPIIAVHDGKSRQAVVDLIPDRSGGIWLLSGGRLYHRHANGLSIRADGPWPSDGFEPLEMAIAPNGHIWIGGAGGLYEFTLSGDRIQSLASVTGTGLRSNTVMAVIVDHRGWIWAGTTQGVSVFDGYRWVSIDSDQGLLWDDTSEGGIREDPDGSIWIATDKGLSHLLDPGWLFAPHPVKIVISQASLGGKNLPARDLPYTTAPLSLQFGTFTYASEKSIVFRYRLSGVDDGWAETVSGGVRYPSVPPGHHVLTVVGYDALSHTSSAPVSLDIAMDYPWWRQWWAELLYLLAGVAALYGFKQWLEHAAALRQRQLERLVEERTARLREAQAALERQATLDGLTGLLNRTEVQHRLAKALSVAHDCPELVVALIDLDHFKTINDRHGHLAGDDVLRAVGVRVSAILRDREYAGRYGGEELLIVLDDADGRGAARILALLQSVRGAPFHLTHTAITVTCSIGVAWAGRGDDWESLIGRADLALYEAKTTGRDKVVESRDDQILSPSAWPRAPRPRRAGSAD